MHCQTDLLVFGTADVLRIYVEMRRMVRCHLSSMTNGISLCAAATLLPHTTIVCE